MTIYYEIMVGQPHGALDSLLLFSLFVAFGVVNIRDGDSKTCSPAARGNDDFL